MKNNDKNEELYAHKDRFWALSPILWPILHTGGYEILVICW